MDILIHTFSGVAVSTGFMPFTKKKIKRPIVLLIAGMVGGAFPDLDAVSLWPGFDTTIGRLFHLSHKGRDIYFAKYWYSHHGFLHSAAGLFISGLIISILLLSIYAWNKKKIPSRKTLHANLILFCVFFLSGLVHLFGDMVTPSSVWGGVRFLWPLKTYYGGLGLVWWWNNYDIFLIIILIIFINLTTIFLRFTATKISRFIPTLILIIGSLVCMNQMASRKYDYNYYGFTNRFSEMEKMSLAEQQEILSTPAYNIFYQFDQGIPFNF